LHQWESGYHSDRPQGEEILHGNARRLTIILCSLSLVGCASVDFDYPKVESHAYTNTTDTLLGREVAALGHIPEGYGGFHLLSNSLDALSSRLLLAERAERSIDAQYYLAYADRIGYLTLRSLLDAADRGVRVRLLLDDFLTGGLSEGLAAMDTHPLIEVRMYNPFARRKFRLGDFTTDFKRVNRRMHNKVLIADNQVAIIGGRNIAEEYFGAGDKYNFGDLDVLGVGHVTEDASEMFDAYWNNQISVPIEALVKVSAKPEAALIALRQRVEKALEGIKDSPYQAALDDSTIDYLEGGMQLSPWAPYQFVYDPPVKPTREEEEQYGNSILTPLREVVNSAQEELIVSSPYFVLQDAAINRIGEFVDRGVTIKVITNSLSSTNHNIVHSGYAPTRKKMLQEGIKLFETRPDARISGVHHDAESKSSLHTKAFIVDRRWFYLGSFNWDPRSAYTNTESGIIIDDPIIATTAAERTDLRLPTAAYEVYLDEKDRLRWKTLNDTGQLVVFTKAPEPGAWTRFKVWFMSLLPIKNQL
jgi:putative cardiolipin synthase